MEDDRSAALVQLSSSLALWIGRGYDESMTTTEHDYIADDLRSLAFPVANLKLLPGNPRRGDVDAVARSYERFGQRKPIVARRSDMTVIAGNHQLQAAQRLGWTHVAVVWTDDDDLTAKAFALADNRVSDFGSYDPSALLALLDEVAVDQDLLAAASYHEAFIADLVISLTPPSIADLADEWETPPPGSGSIDRREVVSVTIEKNTAADFREFLSSVGDDEAAVRRLLDGID